MKSTAIIICERTLYSFERQRTFYTADMLDGTCKIEHCEKFTSIGREIHPLQDLIHSSISFFATLKLLYAL